MKGTFKLTRKSLGFRGLSRIPQGRGRQPSCWGGGFWCQHTKLPNVPKNCMKLRTFWTVGGGGRAPGAIP